VRRRVIAKASSKITILAGFWEISIAFVVGGKSRARILLQLGIMFWDRCRWGRSSRGSGLVKKGGEIGGKELCTEGFALAICDGAASGVKKMGKKLRNGDRRTREVQ